MRNNYLVAITGGIGSGKSTALSVILGEGYPVINLDEITKKLYKTASVKKWLKKNFPHSVSGKIFLRVDKSKISKTVFTDKLAHQKLTDYLAEKIFSRGLKEAKKHNGLVFMEVPLLFEKEYQNYFDKVLVVLRNKEDRINSVIARSNLTREQVLERMSFQVDYDGLDLSPYTLIVNDKGEKELKEKVISFINSINFIKRV